MIIFLVFQVLWFARCVPAILELKFGIKKIELKGFRVENLLLSAYLVQTTSKQSLRLADRAKVTVKCAEKKKKRKPLVLSVQTIVFNCQMCKFATFLISASL